jgi:thioredoxin-like negative regulator of GroEL
VSDTYEEFLEEYGFFDETSEFILRARKEGIVEYVTSTDRFHEILEHEPLVVAVYTTPTCTACAMYKPIYYIVASEHQDGVKWIEVDAYQAPEAAFEYGVTATPTTIIFLKGRPVDGFVGIMDEEGLWETVKQYLEKLRRNKG